MLQDRARRRFALVFPLLAVVLTLAGAVSANAQQSTEDAIGNALGKIFNDVLRGSTDATGTPQTDTALRNPPRSRNEMMMSFSPLVKATAPAVVNVYADRMVQRRSLPFAGDPFFEQFFGQRIPNRTERQSSLGLRRHRRGAWHCGHQQPCHRGSG
jgi:S1-C subfamily serine protease